MKNNKLGIMFVFVIALAIFASVSVNAQSAAANKAWAPFLKKFTSAVRTKNRSAILGLAIDSSRFEQDTGGDSREDWADRIVGKENKYFVSTLKSGGFKPWNGGKILKNSCLWFKFIDNKWYWAGTPCD
jgi:hypothetical protein